MKTIKSTRAPLFIRSLHALPLLALMACALCTLPASAAATKNPELLNASYDVSRELFAEINPAFVAQWETRSGGKISVRQSHDGSSKQARAVAEGLQADVVTFNQASDIELLEKLGLVGPDWQTRFPNHASPYYSLPVFLVRGGNPQKIHDWSDLVRAGLKVVFPNPKTSGNGRYSYLAAYAYALEKNHGDQAKAKEFVGRLLANVPVFDTGGRGATTTFVERKIGDVLITFETEVDSIRHQYVGQSLDAVVPSMSLRADFPVAVVDKVAARHGTQDAARAYLKFLYSDAGQEILAKHYNRVVSPAIAARFKSQFPDVRLVSVDQVFGGWGEVMRVHFSAGGIFDQALTPQH